MLMTSRIMVQRRLSSQRSRDGVAANGSAMVVACGVGIERLYARRALGYSREFSGSRRTSLCAFSLVFVSRYLCIRPGANAWRGGAERSLSGPERERLRPRDLLV